MKILRRPSLLLALAFASQSAEAKTIVVRGTLWDHIVRISTTWWATTLVATILLGVLIGYFVYRSAVNNGRAGGATGAGCLVAVIIFLVCQAVAIVVLAITLFNIPVVTSVESLKNSGDGPIDLTPPPKKPDTPAKNNGDDF